MTYNGKWLPAEPPNLFRLTRKEVIVLNIVSKQERNEYEIWTLAQKEKPPLSWEEVHDAITSLANSNVIRREKE